MTPPIVMKCYSCERILSNDPDAPNLGLWTGTEPRWVYCADSPDCARVTLADHQGGDAWRIEIRDMITADDINADLCTVGGIAHDWRAHTYTISPRNERTSWRCVWCHVVACGNYGEHDPCWRPYHHSGDHMSRSGISWPLGGSRP